MNASKVPVFGVIVATIVGVLFLLPFPSWAALVGIVTSASVFMYAGAPVALGAMRLQKPDLPRTYRLPAAMILSPLAFAGAGWVILFSGWQTYSTLVVALLLGYLLIWLNYAFKLNPNAPAMDWQAAPWIIAWIIGMGVICYLSDFGAGRDHRRHRDLQARPRQGRNRCHRAVWAESSPPARSA